MTASPYVKDPANPTDAELAAAIQRGLADGTLVDAAEWLAAQKAPVAYCRIGIPGEGGVYARADAEAYAQSEVDGGYGLDRADIFLVTQDGTLLVPADRSEGKGTLEWVTAPEGFFEDVLAYDGGWTREDLEWEG